MYQVTFTRKFHKGNLAGLTYKDTITFPALSSAQRWIAGIKANYAKLDYTIEDCKVKVSAK